MILTTIPFMGFYQSLHDGQFDLELEQLFTDESGCNVPWTKKLTQRFFDSCKWDACYKAYAAKYAERFAEEFKLPSMKFESMHSPREYNFVTDRIFVEIDPAEFKTCFDQVDLPAFRELCREELTSRSGFISFYSPDYTDWGPIETWDFNQRGLVMKAWVDQESREGEFDSDIEFELCENFSGNGDISNWMFEHCLEGNRLDAIHSYLLKRAARLETVA